MRFNIHRWYDTVVSRELQKSAGNADGSAESAQQSTGMAANMLRIVGSGVRFAKNRKNCRLRMVVRGDEVEASNGYECQRLVATHGECRRTVDPCQGHRLMSFGAVDVQWRRMATNGGLLVVAGH